MKNAAMIGKAIALVEQGKDVQNFPKYIQALETLVKRAEARESLGVHPKLRTAHQKLTGTLNGLEQRVVQIAAKAAANAAQPSSLSLVTTKIAESASTNFTWKRALILTGAAAALYYAGPELFSLTKKTAAAAGMAGTVAPRVVKTAADTVDRVIGAVELASCAAGAPLSWLNGLGYRFNLESNPPPQTSAEICGMGMNYLTNAWAAGATFKVLSPLLTPITCMMPSVKTSWSFFGVYLSLLALQTAFPETTTKAFDAAVTHLGPTAGEMVKNATQTIQNHPDESVGIATAGISGIQFASNLLRGAPTPTSRNRPILTLMTGGATIIAPIVANCAMDSKCQAKVDDWTKQNPYYNAAAVPTIAAFTGFAAMKTAAMVSTAWAAGAIPHAMITLVAGGALTATGGVAATALAGYGLLNSWNAGYAGDAYNWATSDWDKGSLAQGYD